MDKTENIGYKVRLLHNQLHKRMEYNKIRSEAETGDLTRMQRFTIGYLHHNADRDIYQKDLETEFAISRATASNMLSVMERKGLIIRESVEHDARLKKLMLTEKAKQMHLQAEQVIAETERLLTRGMSEDDKVRLHGYLDLMIQNLAKEDLYTTTISCKKGKNQC